MAKDKGWFRIDRARWESDAFLNNEDRFMWADLCSMVNYRDKELYLKKTQKTITVHEGEIFTSLEHLAERWAVRKSRVLRTINRFERNGWCNTERTENGTLITLINTDNLEVVRNDNRNTTRNTDRNADRNTGRNDTRNDERNRLKNIKEDKNIKTEKEQKKGAPRRLNLWEGAPEE